MRVLGYHNAHVAHAKPWASCSAASVVVIHQPQRLRFFSLKGLDNLAQGNALGIWTKDHRHPEGVR
jgi:hypothetical protein